MLELRYQGDQLVSKTYLSPGRVATSGPAQPSPAG
jgi:hypothetical protein